MKSRTKEILADLKNRMGHAGKAVFERLGLAQELLKDLDWVAEKGSLSNARDFIQTQYFGDVCLNTNISMLLCLREEFDTEDQWKAYNWNLEAMRAELKEREKKNLPTRTYNKATLKQVEDLTEENKSLAVTNQHLIQTLEQEKVAHVSETDRLKARVREMEVENMRLREENASLKGKLEILRERREPALV